MSSELIQLRESQYSAGGGIAVFTHQRPSARNALSAGLRDDYIDMLGRVQNDRNVRALILAGDGGSFCAGGDLKSLKNSQLEPDADTGPGEVMRRRIQAGHRWMEQLRSLDIPVIAAVDGAAFGAGFSIALAADFIFASTRAVFCLSFAKVGLVPDLGAAFYLPRAVGLPLAKELAMTARRVSAAEGLDLGFVHAVVEPDLLLEEAARFARRFLQAPRAAIGLTKNLLNMSYDTSYSALAELEASAQAVASTTPFHTHAINAFMRGERFGFDWDREQP
jgi:enoyl-CoA hydratase/carnithine racemase